MALLFGSRLAKLQAKRDDLRARVRKLTKSLAAAKDKQRRLAARLAKIETKKSDMQQALQRSRAAYKHYDRVFAYADAVDAALGGKSVDLCFVHDALALEAARSIIARTGAPLIFDAVEHPNLAALNKANAKAISACRRTRLLQLGHYDMMRHADMILTVSDCLADVIETEVGASRPAVLRNCRRFEAPANDRRILDDCGLGDGDRVMLYPNDISDPDLLDRALTCLAMLPGDVHLVLMGGTFRVVEEAAPALIAGHGVGDRVHRVAMRSPEDFIAYRSGADMALIVLDPCAPNHRVSLPNRLFEAIMSRLPVVSTDLPCIASVIHDFDCGAVVAENDPKRMATAIESVLQRDRDSWRLSLEAAASCLNWEKERQTLVDVVDRLMPKPAGRVLFLANKRIARNDRCNRVISTLVEGGHTVRVMALDLPDPALRVAGVTYESALAATDGASGAAVR